MRCLQIIIHSGLAVQRFGTERAAECLHRLRVVAPENVQFQSGLVLSTVLTTAADGARNTAAKERVRSVCLEVLREASLMIHPSPASGEWTGKMPFSVHISHVLSKILRIMGLASAVIALVTPFFHTVQNVCN